MMILQFPIQVTGAILPSFLVVISVGDSVHLLHAFYNLIDQGREKRLAIQGAISETFVPMFYTTLTTSIGLLSFTNSGILPIQSFGIFSAFGVWVALLVTLFCLPALLVLVPVKPLPERIKKEKNYHRCNSKLLHFVQKKPKAIVASSMILAASSFYFVGHLSLSHNPLEWFDRDNPVRVSIETIDQKLTGTNPVELLIDTQTEYGIYDPVFLNTLDQWAESIKQRPIEGISVNSTVSIINLIKEANALLSDEKQYVLPNDRELIAQEVLLLQVNAADEVAAYTDNKFKTLRLTISTPWQDAINYTAFLNEIEQSFFRHIKTTSGDTPKLQITGLAAIGNRTVTEMLHSMVSSYLIAGVLVSIVLVMLLKSPKLGAWMMLPNILPILAVLTVMYFSDVPFDIFTLLIASIALGLIVDDSVHFIYTFQRYYVQSGRVVESMQKTLRSVGRALFITTSVLCCGFLVYVFSSLTNMQTFGILTSLCIVLALLADFIVAPAIILLLYRDSNN